LNHMFSVVRFLLFKSRINVITLFKLRGGWQSATFLPIDVGVRTNIISDASVIVLKYLNTLCLSTNVISKGKRLKIRFASSVVKNPPPNLIFSVPCSAIGDELVMLGFSNFGGSSINV